jgi:multimeric flavodoxin WrbA
VKTLLIIAHQPSPNTQRLADAIAKGAKSAAPGVKVIVKPPLHANANDVISSNAVILFTTENFGYMSGALKDFFDRCYYQLIDNTEALPFSLVIRAGLDGTGTKLAVQKIINGLKWREAQACLICKGDYTADFADQCHELGATMAAMLDNNMV